MSWRPRGSLASAAPSVPADGSTPRPLRSQLRFPATERGQCGRAPSYAIARPRREGDQLRPTPQAWR
eukprot:15387559-Alexandrium_andersonii.AAC.1